MIYGKILNLTQHVATPEQIEAGVFEPSAEDKKMIQKLLTFEDIPTRGEMHDRAATVAAIAVKYFTDEYDPREDHRGYAMIGGAPYFMGFLERHLSGEEIDIGQLYAFSKRESIDHAQPDGSVKKTAVFRHCGFVEVWR